MNIYKQCITVTIQKSCWHLIQCWLLIAIRINYHRRVHYFPILQLFPYANRFFSLASMAGFWIREQETKIDKYTERKKWQNRKNIKKVIYYRLSYIHDFRFKHHYNANTSRWSFNYLSMLHNRFKCICFLSRLSPVATKMIQNGTHPSIELIMHVITFVFLLKLHFPFMQGISLIKWSHRTPHWNELQCLIEPEVDIIFSTFTAIFSRHAVYIRSCKMCFSLTPGEDFSLMMPQ